MKLASLGWELSDNFGPGQRNQAFFSQTLEIRLSSGAELLDIISQAFVPGIKKKIRNIKTEARLRVRTLLGMPRAFLFIQDPN